MASEANLTYYGDEAAEINRAVFRAHFAPGGALELLGRDEVARELGVRASNLGELKGLPEPIVTHLPRRRLWLASEIREFAKRRNAG